MSQAEVELRARIQKGLPLWMNLPDTSQSSTVAATPFISSIPVTMNSEGTPALAQTCKDQSDATPMTSEEPEKAQPVIYQCQHCSLLFTTETEIRQHLLTHLAPSNLRAFEKEPQEESEKGSESEGSVVQIHHTLKPLYCRVCKESFPDYQELLSHKVIHMTDKFECLTCGKFFAAKTSLTLHERTHTGERPFACKDCGKTFMQHQHLVYHEMSHTGEKPFRCNVCEKTFVHQAALKMHMRTHTGEKPYECNLCGKRFKQRQHLVYHGQTHSDTKPFHCDVCGKDFSHMSSLKTHMKIHTGVKPFKCEVCSKTFFQKQHMLYHMGTHTGDKQFKCGLCEKSFVHRAALKAHLRNSHSESSSDYHCDSCDHNFANFSALQSHMKLHTGERPFSCSTCGKTFVQKQHLDYHMVTHTGLKKVRCLVCQKRFVHRQAFKVHNTNVHAGSAGLSVDCLKCGLGFDDEVKLKVHPCSKSDQEPIVPDSVAMEASPELGDSPTQSAETRKSARTPKPRVFKDMVTDSSLCHVCGKPEKDHDSPCVSESVEGSESTPDVDKVKSKPLQEDKSQKSPVKSGNKRGRPKKCVTGENNPAVTETSAEKSPKGPGGSPIKHGRGRPKKLKFDKVAMPAAPSGVSSQGNSLSYKCLECQLTFAAIGDLLAHIHSHAKKPVEATSQDPQEEPPAADPDFTRPCEGDKVDEVNNPEPTPLEDRKDFECPECEQRFSRMSILHVHLRRHSVEKPLMTR